MHCNLVNMCVSSKGSGVLWGFSYFLEILSQSKKNNRGKKNYMPVSLQNMGKHTLYQGNILSLLK